MRSVAKQPASRHPASPGRTDAQHDHPSRPDNAVIQLQQIAGNQAVQRLISSGEIAAASDGRPSSRRTTRAVDPPGEPTGGGSHTTALQRHVFINETQVTASSKGFTAQMNAMLTDDKVRNYTDAKEFKKHADQKTDYLGNLADGTWVRFSPTGINLLGETHTATSLEKVVPFINTTSFIYEPFASDKLAKGSNIKAAYETENATRFQTFGITTAKDKRKYGAESLFPKMGFALTLAIPYFEGKSAITGLDSSDYTGQPVQRYLKIAWAYSKDNRIEVDQRKLAKKTVDPKLDALATVHTAIEAQVDAFITGLVVDGFIGDELKKPTNATLLPPLAQFVRAFTDAIVALSATDNSSRLPKPERKAIAGGKTLNEVEKSAFFAKWRNYTFEDNVKAATKSGVRYAGMGQRHLDHLVDIGLDKNQHPFEMDGQHMRNFTDLTNRLKSAAK